MRAPVHELEIIRYPQTDGLCMFFDTIDYRTAHFHPEWEILLVLENALLIHTAGEEMTLSPGEMVLFNPWQAHEFHRVEESCTALFLQFSTELFSMAFPKIEHLIMEDSRLTAWLCKPEQEEIIGLLFHMMDVYLKEEDGYELECISGSAELFRRIYLSVPHHVQTDKELMQKKKRTQRLSRFLKFVDENYMFKIKLADFAKQEDMSLAYMSVFVRKELGQTFQEYVNSVRFNAACKMMAAGESSMQTICLESGFSDYRYFSNEFRRRKGVTPEQYSRNPDPSPDAQKTHQSLHSLERFYSRARSGELLVDYREKIRQDRAI